MRVVHKTIGVFVVAEEADFCYITGPREVGPMPEQAAFTFAQRVQQQVDAERIARLAPFLSAA